MRVYSLTHSVAPLVHQLSIVGAKAGVEQRAEAAAGERVVGVWKQVVNVGSGGVMVVFEVRQLVKVGVVPRGNGVESGLRRMKGVGSAEGLGAARGSRARRVGIRGFIFVGLK